MIRVDSQTKLAIFAVIMFLIGLAYGVIIWPMT